MVITLKEITVQELTSGYVDNEEDGVRGFSGKLDIRPPYQREFVYSDSKRDAVIDTIEAGFPLNVMYWADREDGTYEIIDGQQRTISICQYVTGDFPHNMLFFNNLQDDEKEKILNYRLMIYVCRGTDSEKLKWFETINIAGEELNKQELLNAVYAGSWLSDAKRFFSKNNCAAYRLASKYLKGEVKRQDYLATAIQWISKGNTPIYMATHMYDPNANALWLYFQEVVNWVKTLFPIYRKEMKGQDWGKLYDTNKNRMLDAKVLEKEVKVLMEDVDVSKKTGIYPYVFDHDERHLNIRIFDARMRREAYERQQGICPMCGEHFDIGQMEADHIKPWSKGGKTIAENCQMLCVDCNRRKSNK